MERGRVSARWRRNDSRDNRAADARCGRACGTICLRMTGRVGSYRGIVRRRVPSTYWFDRSFVNGISFFARPRHYCLRDNFAFSHSTRDASRVINYPDVFSNRSIIKSIVLLYTLFPIRCVSRAIYVCTNVGALCYCAENVSYGSARVNYLINSNSALLCAQSDQIFQ